MTKPNQSNHILDIRKMVVDNTQENKTSEIVQIDEGDTNSFDSRLDEILKRFDYERDYREAEQSIQELIDRKVKEAFDERQKSKS